MAAESAWRGASHKDKGVATFGGTDDSDLHSEVAAEHRYRRYYFEQAVLFGVLASGLLVVVIANARGNFVLRSDHDAPSD